MTCYQCVSHCVQNCVDGKLGIALGQVPKFGGKVVNNWNPWIASNWLAAVLLLEDDVDRRNRAVYKILRCLDNFLNPYPDDGGCDEGPGYWTRAGALRCNLSFSFS